MADSSLISYISVLTVGVQSVMLIVLLLCQISTAFLDDASIWLSREDITEVTEEVKDKDNRCCMPAHYASLGFYNAETFLSECFISYDVHI